MRYRFAAAMAVLTVVGAWALPMPEAVAHATSAAVVAVTSAAKVPAGAHSLGAMPSNSQVHFSVALRSRNQPGLDALLQQLSSPDSPYFRHFLAPDQFGQRFGPASATVLAVTAALRALGLTVDGVDGAVLRVSGSVAQVSSALHTSFGRYQLASGRVVYANVSTAQLPAEIASSVVGIVGLDDLSEAKHVTHSPTKSAATSGPVCPAPGTAATGPYRADQVAAYYGLTSAYAENDYGAGINVAVVELETYSPSDIAAYQTCYGSTARVSTTRVLSGAGAGDDGGAEATLDIEDIAGLAPKSSITSYEAPNSLDNLLTVFQRIASDDTAQVVSTSWGLCEPQLPAGFAASERVVFQQMAAQGQSVFAASGDLGSEGCGADAGLAVDDPASQPEVTGVGGTALTSPTGPEYLWNGFGNASGGGVSRIWAMPSWQRDVGIVGGSSGTPCRAGAGSYCREVPDVSASAEPYYGYAVYLAGKWIALGGTSAAAPTWAALVALTDAKCTGNHLGLINPVLYAMERQGVDAFHDISGGTNDLYGVGDFMAVPGYDMATGLGTPIGATLISDLCGTTVTVQPTSVHASAGGSLSFTYIAPSPDGLSNGAVTLTVPAGWSAPSTSPTGGGYTTASAGTVAVSGSTITVSDLTLDAGDTVTINYGDVSGGGIGAVAPSTAQISSFVAQWRRGSTGGFNAVANPPTISVYGQAPDGSGNMQVSTGHSEAGATNYVSATSTATLTFTYTPSALSYFVDGDLTLDVPADWTAPTTGSGAGNVTSSAGQLTVAGRHIDVSGVDLDAGNALTITYASATAPDAVELSSFIAAVASGGRTAVALAVSPTVRVSVAADGIGTLLASSVAYAGMPSTLTFEYVPYWHSGQIAGEVDVTIPHDWTPPQAGSAATPGYVTASAGTTSVSNTWTIRVTDVTLAMGQELTITYGANASGGGAAIAPATTETSSFSGAQASTADDSPVPLSYAPKVQVLQLASNGAGSMTVGPSKWVAAGAQTWLSFDYSLPGGFGMINGEVTVELPAGWAPPSTDSTAPGYTTTSVGTLAISAEDPRRIDVTGLNFVSGGGLDIEYGRQPYSAGTARAPSTPGTWTFSAEAANNGGSLAPLAASPALQVLAPAADGTGTITALPSNVVAGAPTTITFLYTPDAGTCVVDGELDITVPPGWTAPQWVDGSGPGNVSATPAGTPQIGSDGRTIKVTFSLGVGDPLRVTYTRATPPVTSGPSVFTAQMANAGGTMKALSSSPSITIGLPSSGGGGGGGGGVSSHPQLQRVAGSDRVGTSIAASQTGFPKDDSARVVALARADSFADALAGTPLAALRGGPLLLTASAQLDGRVRSEIERVLPRGATVYLLGGTSALAGGVAGDLTADGYVVQRLAGADRYGTAVAIAQELGDPGTIFEASGLTFADALSAGTAASREGAAILLTAGGSLPPATAQYLAAHPGDLRIAVGGPAATADPSAHAYRGADRYATSLLMATTFFPTPSAVGLASGVAFPDALAGGVITAIGGGPMLLVPPTGGIATGTQSYLGSASSSASALWLFGGTASVDSDVFDQINAASSG
jgi:hypothetical protein